MARSRWRRRWPAIALTVVTMSLLYVSVVLWISWSGPSFDLSGFDTGGAVARGGRDGSIAWPIAASALACCAITATAVAWRSARRRPDVE